MRVSIPLRGKGKGKFFTHDDWVFLQEKVSIPLRGKGKGKTHLTKQK